MAVRGRSRCRSVPSAGEQPITPVDAARQIEVLDGLFASWDAIDRLLAGLPEAQWQTPTPLPGWSVHDVVAHVIGTESMLQGIATPEADVDVSTLKHVRNAIGVMNERWVRKLRGLYRRGRCWTASARRPPSAGMR